MASYFIYFYFKRHTWLTTKKNMKRQETKFSLIFVTDIKIPFLNTFDTKW